VRIANLPYRWLAPIILFLCVLGGMVVRNSMFDLWVMLFFGLIGFAARKGKFPIPPMVLGIILGNRLETYFRQTAVLGFGYVLTRPFALAITALAVAMVFVFGRYKSKHAGAQGHGESGGGK
jgi:putative tricarboxylic transport membrane protein